MAQLQLELDEIVGANLASRAAARGVKPEQLAAELVKTGLNSTSTGTASGDRRSEAIEEMKRDRKGRLLGLSGMSAREFAHLDHKY